MTVVLLLLSIVALVLLITKLQLHPFLSLLIVSITFGLVAGMPGDAIITSIQDGFGGTLGKIGLIIILGVVIGAFLENTGGAMALAQRVLKVVGEKNVNSAMGIVGWIISIPVFSDSGFILLSSLNRNLTKKAGLSLAGTAIALSIGLTVTHNLIPPTPGPIAAAGTLGADLGLVIQFGFIVSVVALIGGLIFAKYYAARTYIDPEEGFNSQVEKRPTVPLTPPSAARASFPILIPIVLIIARSVINILHKDPDPSFLVDSINFIGSPVIALLIGFFLCLLLPKQLEKTMVSADGWIGKAFKDAAGIILITGAGGIFGKMLQNSGLAGELGETLATYNVGIFLPFVLASALKLAQGSSTVALVTTAGILLPLMPSLGMVSEVDKALVVTAIGCGSMVASHANDSFFWVVTQMSGMDVKTGYRLQTLGSALTGILAMLVTSLLFAFNH